jgi:hypothetical protein
MNENTLVVACGYAGDAHQVRQNMPLYVHHECPVVVMSPEDSPIDITTDNVKSRHLGKRAYIGAESLERQRLHLEAALEYKADHFLFNDSDSFCLSTKIPDYLYREPDVVWSNLVIDDVHTHQRPKDYTFPQIAFQPPYFLSRKTIEKMLAVAKSIVVDPITPFIDHYMVQLAVAANLPYRGFADGVSCGTTVPETGLPHTIGSTIVGDHIKDRGACMIHSVKHIDVVHMCVGLWDQIGKHTHARLIR